MQEIVNITIGVLVLIMGIPIGNFLASQTKEEIKPGRRWFNLIIIVSLLGGMIGLIIGNDVLMFSFFFIAIVTSRSLRK